jgi:FAD/FMN-containing dehydrogenase
MTGEGHLMAVGIGDAVGIGAELRAHFRGALLEPGEEGYDDARRVWNGLIDRRPALIARCAGADDVAEAVRFARERDLEVSVRGGGHSVSGHSVRDGGLMIDLSLMKSIRVEPESRTARASGGVLWGELDRATQRFGLALTGGMISHTGIGGLTLGGGLGNLMRKLGLTVDSLRAVDLVTAEGERARVDAESDPELFWGLRGGGGNFGIATAFEYDVHPIGPMVLGGPMLWAIDDAPAVLRHLRENLEDAPDDLGIALFTRLAPPMPFISPDNYGKPVLMMLVLWTGDPVEGRRIIDPLRRIGSPLADAVTMVPYAALQAMGDQGAPHGNHYYWKSHRLPGLSEEIIDVLVDAAANITSPFSQIGGWLIGGAASRVDASEAAVGDREVGLELNVTAAWSPTGEKDAHVAWVRRYYDKLSPFSRGVYANFVSDEEGGVEAAYGDRLARLTALKDRVDPMNFFRFNANVAPSNGRLR